MSNIASALVKAQKGFAPALKTSTNPHFRSKYADLAACIEAVIDSLNENGIALIQVTHESTNGVIVETMFIHESGESLSAGKLHVPAGKHDPQGYGGALTYARRYSLMAACGIAPEDDDGNKATQAWKSQPKTLPAESDARTSMDELADLMKEHGLGTLTEPHPKIKEILSAKNRKTCWELDPGGIDRLITWIKAKKYES